MAWEWGVTGEKMVFQSFGRTEPGRSNNKKYAWHCIIMDPVLKYKWSARSCVERKHYICEVPAGRLGKKCIRNIQQKKLFFIHNFTDINVTEFIHDIFTLSARRRKKSDPFAPQNQRLKPRKKGKKYLDEQGKQGTSERKKTRVNSRRNWIDQGENQQWAHGVKLGSRPPSKY